MTTPNQQAPCAACGAAEWLPLPEPGGQTVTTAGRIVAQALGKSHCAHCGIIQRTGQRYFAQTDFYEKQYSFYQRPGAERFDHARYDAMAAWIAGAMPATPRRVLDAGCGRGWMIDALRAVLPDARFSGIEPSEQESENARQRGLDVTTGRVGGPCGAATRYDLVYSTNVLEHTESPVDFLRGLGAMLNDGGRVIVTCPDATAPGCEMLFADQNFSFLPTHLFTLAASAGLEVVAWQGAPPQVSLRDKQLVVLGVAGSRSADTVLPAAPPLQQLYNARCAYVQSWTALESMLRGSVRGASHVYNFGTSTWSFLLAAYCPQYWCLVTACLIDGGAGEFMGKPVHDADRIRLTDEDVVVLSVDPDRQRRFAERFEQAGAKPVSWHTVVAR